MQAAIQEMTPDEARYLLYDWSFWARPKQLPPSWDWRIWLLLAGRGFGKTRTITEWARERAKQMPKSRGALVAATAADARDVLVEGESGILAVSPDWFKPIYEPSKRRLTWPNGTVATIFSADEPDRLRGPQHHWALCDELAAWRYPDAWDMLMMGLRLGDDPQCVVATTPRPTPLIRELIVDESVAVTRGSTYENRGNLAPAFFKQIIKKYEGTRLGRQELLAELLLDIPGALWTRETLEKHRKRTHPPLVRVVVAIDPAASASNVSSETGIIVAGVDGNGQGYVIDDLTLKDSPARWGEVAVMAFDHYQADRIIGETNNGGDMVEHVVRTAAEKLHRDGKRTSKEVSFKQVRASRGKHTRAEPVAALDEQGRIHHMGMFAQLEDQLCTWVPGEDSPDRLDARVWAFTELMLDGEETATATSQVVTRQTIEDLLS